MTAYVFIRRTPRALNFHDSSTRPMMVRRAGTQQRRINYNALRRDDDLLPVANGLTSAIKKRTHRVTLTVDLEHVAANVSFKGYTLTYMPASPMFRECIMIEVAS
jgi:hypothetical protein